MKKIINILLAVCLMVSLLGVSALAADEYTGPATHSWPVLIDFNDEAATTGDNGKSYSSDTATPKNFYNLSGVTKAYGSDGEVELRGWGTAGVESYAAIRFKDFVYDASAENGVQPTKLVISFDARYINIDSDQAYKDGELETRFNDMGTSGQHFSFGYKESMSIAGGSTLTDDNGFFRWSFETDAETSKITAAKYNRYTVLPETELNNQAFRTKIENGDDIKYTFVFDLTRDENGKGNTIVYIDGDKSSALLSYTANVEKLNTFGINANRYKKFAYDNVRIYTVDNEAVAATGASVSGADVPLTTEEVTVNFSHEITEAADKYLVVKKGEDVLIPGDDYTVEHVASEDGIKTAKALKVKFTNALSYGTTYEIGATEDYFGIDGNAIGEAATFASFTTESAPQINLSALAIKKGFFGGIDVTSLADCLGSTVSLTTTATSAETDAAIGTVFFGVYKNDVLVNLAMVNKTFAPAEADEISVNVMLPAATESDVVEIKAFACEGLGNLDAYGTVQSISTAD